ncbi:MAG: DUF350 domain-containing protein [Candidatus Sericytochromatia bacterium]|nr:DUF350 domain-containing protein [Candidatus Sericytochromatia bacterium]
MIPTAHLLMRIAASIGWTLLGVLIFIGGINLFDRLDPIDYRKEIEKGNVAAAIKLAAVILGLAALVVTAILT